MNQTYVIITFFLILAGIASAQQPDNPTEPPTDTLQTVRMAEVHPRSLVTLARELRGISDVPAPATAPEYAIGDRDTFYVTNYNEERTVTIEAEVRHIGEHIVHWVEVGASDFVEIDDLAFLSRIFDEVIYPESRALWGSEVQPGVDGDLRVHSLFAADIGPGPTAYFSRQNSYTRQINESSNEREMFVFNLRSTGYAIGNLEIASILAHEFQHMIRANVAQNTDSWLNEGFSMFSPVYLGLDDGDDRPRRFLEVPQLQLNRWQSSGANYGAGLMFVTYLYEEYGLEVLQAVSAQSEEGLYAVNKALAASGGDMDTFFADWAAANIIQDSTHADGRYGYELLTDLTAPPVRTISSYPRTEPGTAFSYSTHYFELKNLQAGETLSLTFNAAKDIQLVPAQAASGQRMWYSNRGDDSMMRLTRAFDLRGVSEATLNYSVWFDTEILWDYGYVMVSTDDGETWALLTTPHMTSENPHFTGLGTGYTGESDGWIDESITLDDYAGQEIQIRFMIVNDDATHDEGLLIDDIAIPEIGYFSDFEADDGGWMPEGWVWMDNRLTSRAWVQIIQIMPDDVQITRLLWTGEDPAMGTIEAVIGADAGRVLVAVSPITPETFLPVDYTLTFAKEN